MLLSRLGSLHGEELDRNTINKINLLFKLAAERMIKLERRNMKVFLRKNLGS